MTIVPKGPRAGNATGAAVRHIDSAKSRGRGRPSGLGYDPSTGQEQYAETYQDAEYDVFGTVREAGYSEDRFYTRSTDLRGHGSVLRITMPQGLDSQVYAAVNEIPEYRSVQDFFRDAALHRLEYIQRRYKISEGGQRMLVLERYRADREQRSQEIDSLTTTVEEISEGCQKAWDANDYGLLAQELEKGGEAMEWLRDPYRSKVDKILKDWKGRAKEELTKMDNAARE